MQKSPGLLRLLKERPRDDEAIEEMTAAAFGPDRLHKTVYRMDTFQKLIGQKKWSLQLPLTAHGVVISQAALGASDDEPVVISADDAAERVLRLTIPMMQGTDVKKVQRALGFSGDAVDGSFGPDTDVAVRTFQQNHGLFVDGKVGNATRTALGL